MSFALDTPVFMSRESFYRGCAEQPEGRYERVDGEVIAMSPERFGHARTKQAIFMALLAAMAQTRFSPNTSAVDTGGKLAAYFHIPSVAHYLIVHPTRRPVIHHARGDGLITKRILASGDIQMEPPGIRPQMRW